MLNKENIRAKLFLEVTFLQLHAILHDYSVWGYNKYSITREYFYPLKQSVKKWNLNKVLYNTGYRVLLLLGVRLISKL